MLSEMGLEESKGERYRSVLARVNFLARDRPEISYSVKELCHETPSRSHGRRRVKNLGRCLKGMPRFEQGREIGMGLNSVVNVYEDSGSARCARTAQTEDTSCCMDLAPKP